MQRISIPETMTPILTQFVLAILEEQPTQLIEWGAKYFENLSNDYSNIFYKKVATDNWDNDIDLPTVLSMFRNEDLQNHICKGDFHSAKAYLQTILDFQYFPTIIDVGEYLNKYKK